jgi:hypothetical protein
MTRSIVASIVLTVAIVFSLNGIYESANDPITEDDPGWSCVDDGNRICGPNNDEGKPAACYDEGGVIEMYWPCERDETGKAVRK